LARECELVIGAGFRRALDRDAVGRNIFDKSYDITRNFFLPSNEVAAAGEPTTVGIRLTYKY